MSQPWVVGGIFLITYGLIATERVDRTIAAMMGGIAMIVVGGVDQSTAFAAVDWNVIFLLVGMMVIASVLSDTGLFQWIAIRAVVLGKGDPLRILVLLAVVTAVGSALLDNVTIIVLITSVTLFVANALGASPVPFLVAEILASNIGGAATLIGDPPNILIGSAANIDFTMFATNMAPVSIVSLLVFLAAAPWLFRADLAGARRSAADIEKLAGSELITDPLLLRRSLVVLAFVILGFLFHGRLHLEPATIALAGATALMWWGGLDTHKLFGDVEWTTLFFFIGLFITVESVVQAGFIDALAVTTLDFTGSDPALLAMLLLWISAIASGVIDNIPYTAAMIPFVQELGNYMPVGPLWWALAMGASLGGNVTLIGASANVVAASVSERSGHPIGFRHFLRYGIPVTFLTLTVASAYLWVRYLRVL